MEDHTGPYEPKNSDSEEGEIAEVQDKDCEDSYLDTGYEKREVFYHSSSGYYYDPVGGCYLVPATPSNTPAISEQDKSVSSPSSTREQREDLLSKISEVSEKMTSQCGLVYDNHSGLYYDSQSGLYYDQMSRLYYSVQYNSYFYYNEETQEYHFHSQATSNADDQDEEDVVFDADEGHTPSPKVREIEESWPPCLRLVVVSSEKMTSGQVFMITKVGSDIGREVSERSGVRIKDVYVSKLHASVSFDEEEELFYIKDCGSVCGTFVNGRRLSDAKERSCLHPLVHGDTVAMGTSTFSVHIHKGLDVCNDCLPQPTISKGKSLYESVQCLEKERVETMDVLKRQYGLKGPQRQDPRSQPTHYHNRAEERRRLHGSEPLMSEPMSTTQASSLQRPIESSNLGHQLLSKMGWEEGRGLGRDGKGPTEPMVVVTRDPSAGLGSEHSSAILGEGSRSERSRRMLKRLNDARYQLPTDNKRTQVWVRGSITKFKRQ